jgi:hypothetical protein
MLKIKKLEKSLNKIMKKETSADGYVRIDKVVIYPDGNQVEISGGYGEYFADGDQANWQENFRLDYVNGRNLDFIKGMFYQFLCEHCF